MCWHRSRTNIRDDILVQDKFDWDWHRGALRQYGNRGDGRDQVQPRRPDGNVGKCGKWYFTIDDDTKDYIVNWRRDLTGRGGSAILRAQELNWYHFRWKTTSKARPKKLIWVKGDVRYVCSIVVGVFGYLCALYDQVLKLWRVLNHPWLKVVK